MIVFMIAHNVDHVRESVMAALKEVMESIATIFWTHHAVWITLCDIMSNTDIAAQDQYLGSLIIFKIKVSKFKMHVRR